MTGEKETKDLFSGKIKVVRDKLDVLNYLEKILLKLLTNVQGMKKLLTIETLGDISLQRLKSRKKKTKHYRQKSMIFNCELCDLKYDQLCELELHIKSKHEIHEEFQCAQCGQKFVTDKRLKKHKENHSRTSIIYCRYFKNNIYCPYILSIYIVHLRS